VAVALVAAAVLMALLASDLVRWRDAVRSGDLQFGSSPADARWTATAVLPQDPARSLLDLGSQLELRSSAQSFEVVRAAGRGYDNGVSEAHDRGELEARLAALAQEAHRQRASYADNLLGILAFTDSRRAGPTAPAPVDQSVADFQAAVRLDPSNDDAKFNLERLLRELVARGSRLGSSGAAAGPAKGHRGAGGGLPGRGY
jgi:hypothetical protein